MITGIYELKILAKHVSCECKYKFNEKKNVIQINGEITINVNVIVKDMTYVKKKFCYT